ncbi:protein phosphatase 2C domain-containing protein [Chamaesiphon minutus]|uniref:PPM-type phosphatase domain-containing protein n=1 Tax=Chamaesiphon minutus (strain ATCC 27169 / PCC 6605) TaxID=1173020 RepID=K9USL3_CHAP6|nr:protein phosphatase 2C domain-containing protein [Chamaesiphon minutus]AFY97249.1 hypothetical protein Cha6605_6434 [Chamaesiphon minutus PCC 6605]
MNNFNIVKSINIGSRHQESNQSCQDHADYKFICENQILIAAVSDGLGSAEYSGDGSKLAVETAIIELEYQLKQHVNNLNNISGNEEQAKTIFTHVLKSVQERLRKRSRELIGNTRSNDRSYYRGKELDCTLLAVAIAKDFIIAIQIGDGMIVSHNFEANDYCILLDSTQDIVCGRTLTVMHPECIVKEVKLYYNKILSEQILENIHIIGANNMNSESSKRISKEIQIYTSNNVPSFICMATDGIEDFAFEGMCNSKYILYQPLFQSIDHLMKDNKQSDCQDFIDREIKSEEWQKCGTDDKTMLIISRPQSN